MIGKLSIVNTLGGIYYQLDAWPTQKDATMSKGSYYIFEDVIYGSSREEPFLSIGKGTGGEAEAQRLESPGQYAINIRSSDIDQLYDLRIHLLAMLTSTSISQAEPRKSILQILKNIFGRKGNKS